MLLKSIYVNNIQLCTPFPDFSHLGAATKMFLVKMTALLEDPLESKKYLRGMILLLGEMLVTSRQNKLCCSKGNYVFIG